MEPLVKQLILILVLFLFLMVCGLLPVLVFRHRRVPHEPTSKWSGRIHSWISCFAGGVFIGMCFVGLLPMAVEQFHQVSSKFGWTIHFPFAELVMVVGFFSIMILEEIMHYFFHDRSHGTDSPKSEVAEQEIEEDEHTEMQQLIPEEEVLTSHSNQNDKDHEKQTQSLGRTTTSNHEKAVPAPSSFNAPIRGHNHEKDMLSAAKETGLKLALLMFAINLHSFFEGIALGLQKDAAKMVSLFIAILIHESVVAFAIGATMSQSRFTIRRAAKYLFLFCVSIPIGIGTGVLIVQFGQGKGGDLASAILQAIATGIFLYVTFMQVIPEEMRRVGSKFGKIIFMFLGFILMCFITYIMEESL